MVMSARALAEIEDLLNDLGRDEQLELLEVLARRLRGDASPAPEASTSLHGILKNVSADFDLDAALQEIRSDWVDEWPDRHQ